MENITKTLERKHAVRERLGDEFKILFEMVRCKQGDHALFSKLLESSVSTRYYKGLFSYLWPDTILSK